MDPLTIVAGAIAIAQAVDRIIALSSQTKRLLNAPVEIDALITEINELKVVLDGLRLGSTQVPPGDALNLGNLLESCSDVAMRIENTIQGILIPINDNGGMRVRHVEWMRKRRFISQLKDRLAMCKSQLALHLAGMSL